MSAPWLHIVGIGEDGVAGLSAAARALVESAEVIIGGDRHHALTPDTTAERLAWPSPFDAMIDVIRAQRGRRVVILVTGDPLWYSVGARITKAVDPAEIVFHPQLSAFQWAACRMGWSLADVETLTVHGRPPEQILPFLYPGARLLVLTQDGATPGVLAALLTNRGFGPSAMTVLANLGGPTETRRDAVAAAWTGAAPPFHTLAIECRAAPDARPLPRTGLPDEAFRHDGVMTKREMRALTLAALGAAAGALLWDVGCGSGSVAIEWMRADRDMAAVGIEPRDDRRALAAENALALGAPRLRLVAGTAPAALAGLPAPDAAFIGGGLSAETVAACLEALKPFGRLVANAVTLESEALLLDLHARYGGDLTRASVSRAAPVGGKRGWRSFMPVTQWRLNK